MVAASLIPIAGFPLVGATLLALNVWQVDQVVQGPELCIPGGKGCDDAKSGKLLVEAKAASLSNSIVVKSIDLYDSGNVRGVL